MRETLLKTPPKYRKISPFEWVYLSATASFPPFAIQLKIEVDTLPPLEELENALVAAASANPGARQAVAGIWWVDSGKTPPIRVMRVAETFSLNHPCFHQAFTFTDSPPIEVLFWPGVGLIFRCSHALMDAGGLLFFVRETFRALRGEPLLGTDGRVSDYDYLKGLKHTKHRTALWPDKRSPLGPPAADKTGFIWEHRFIPGQVAAVGARLAGALGAMAEKVYPGDSGRIMLPVDLRQIDGSLRSTGNLSNALFLEKALTVGWTGYYRDILDALRRHEERAISRGDAMIPKIPRGVLQRLFHWLHAFQVRNDRYLFSATISHVAPIALREFSVSGCVPKSVALLPFDAPGSAITLITAQHDHGLEIAASAPAATGDEGRLAKALDVLCAELGGCGSSITSLIPARAGDKALKGPQRINPEITLYELFARQAKGCSERTAVSERGRQLSYWKLERLAVSCAYRLLQHGVLPGDKVAILGGCRLESIIALLGILHLGASFVPMDPGWPGERIRFVLNDCLPTCLLTDEMHFDLAGFSPRLLLSELLEETTCTDDVRFESIPKTPAYVLYTSGSTGHPKGVVVGQASIVNYLLWAKESYLSDMVGRAVFPFFTSPAFDLTLTSIFLPLVSGGEIRIFPQHDALLTIPAILADPEVNVVKLTPSHLRLFEGLGIGNSNVRRFIVGGEALPTQLAKAIYGQSGGCAEIFNEYGPTEATVGCVMHRFDAERDVDAFVPIGYPIMNTEVLLLNEDAIPVAEGEVGEIYLAGACLAEGYLARPDESVRFTTHPFHAGARAYRTGDRARRLPSGALDFLGRTDQQVKILGYRIEPGEIDAAIAASHLCREFAVLPEKSANGIRLTAFVTLVSGVSETRLRQVLAESLPTYMIPSRIVALDKMPLNTNGKVDRTRLPVAIPVPHEGTDVASDDMLDVMRNIIKELTENTLARVAHDKSLLDLGLDSLQMMMLLTLSAKRFLPEIAHDLLFSDLENFIRKPTLQTLAAHFRKLACGEARSD